MILITSDKIMGFDMCLGRNCEIQGQPYQQATDNLFQWKLCKFIFTIILEQDKLSKTNTYVQIQSELLV